MDVTTKSSSSEEDKQFINIDKEKDCRADSPLSDPITDWKSRGELASPLHITLLVLVDVQQKPKEDGIHTSVL